MPTFSQGAMANDNGLMFVIAILSILCYKALAIQLGDKLNVGRAPWTSSDRTFAFGFTNTTTENGMYTLAIWYQSTSRVVWEATLDHGMSTKQRVKVSQNGEVEVNATGLVVTNGGLNSVWRSNLVCNNCSVSGASLEDNGNFVLRDSGTTSIWESFSSPTDTIVPEQELLGNVSLVSGRYRLSMNKSSIGLYYDGFPVNESYWSVNNEKLDATSPSSNFTPRLVFNRNGSFNFYDASGKSWNYGKYENAQRYPIDYASEPLRRLTLERNGTLRSYSTHHGTEDQVVWQSLLMECEVFGTCGDFGMCKYQPKKSCFCPPGFHQTRASDHSNGAEFSGCSYNIITLNCTNPSRMIEIGRADLLRTGYYSMASNISSVSLERCKRLCLDDCRCVAATYMLDGSGLCLRKDNEYPFSIGQSLNKASIVIVKVSASDSLAQADPDFMKNLFITSMNASDLYQSQTTSKFFTTSRTLVLAVAVGEFGILCAFAVVALLWWRRSNRKMWMKIVKDRQGPTRFTYEQLEAATGNFRDKLGSGGYGTVYKGVLPDNTVVAVKTLEVATHGENQFRAEVATLGKIHHVNLVKLTGYCVEGIHRILVYEYMSNGSLDKALATQDMNWNTRCLIALGIAKGITYLHEECYECILHCDIKPQNILLDQNWCPKVADFGLAKLTKKELALSVTTIRGTRGYLAPEWISDRPITPKVDVFSYGMVLLELLVGNDKSRSGQNGILSVWAFQNYISGDLETIVDPKLVETVEYKQFERMLKTAFWCIQLEANTRPTMGHVVQMLEDYGLEVDVPPFPTLMDRESGNDSSSIPPESHSILEAR